MTHPTTEHCLRAVLIECRDQFQKYGDHHMDKQPPQYEKARVNYTFVRDINDTLLNAHTLPADEEFGAVYDQLVSDHPQPGLGEGDDDTAGD